MVIPIDFLLSPTLITLCISYRISGTLQNSILSFHLHHQPCGFCGTGGNSSLIQAVFFIKCKNITYYGWVQDTRFYCLRFRSSQIDAQNNFILHS